MISDVRSLGTKDDINLRLLSMKNFLKFVFYWVALILDCYVKATRKTDRGNIEKKTVCLMKADGIGDTLIWLGSFQALYQYYKDMDYDIILICAAPCKIFYAETFDFLQLIEIDIRKMYRFKYRYEILKKIRKLPLDVLVNCAYSRTISIDSIARVSSAAQKLGNSGDATNTPGFIKTMTDRIYTNLAPATNEINEMSKNKNLLQWLGVKDHNEKIAELPPSFASEEGVKGDYFVVFPGASLSNKCWPVENFAECCNQILAKRTWKLVVCGGKGEVPVCKKLQDLMEEKERVIDLSGKTSIKQLSSVIAQSKFVLTNDTSAVHFAIAWKVPNLCISKGCDIGRFVPYHDSVLSENRILHKTIYTENECSGKTQSKCFASNEVFPCIKNITAEMVMQETEYLLDKIGE